MKAIPFACAVLLVSACSSGKSADTTAAYTEPAATTAAAATTTGASEKVDPDMVELRISVPKGSLPAALAAAPGTTEESAKPRLAAADADKVRTLLSTLGMAKGTESTCFTVCEPECHEVGGGTGTVCVSHCHRECF